MAEEEIEFNVKDYVIRGTINVPESEDPPYALFVHGAGPQDRDGTVGPNKMWKDIAEGLRAEGIASLRFDKTIHGECPKDLDGETIDDALAAVNFLRNHGASEIYIVGQSLGAFLAPEIAERSGANGAVMLAPPARDIVDIIVDQKDYQLKLKGIVEDDRKKTIEALRHTFDPIEAHTLPEGEAFEGAYASYWYDIRSRKPTEKIGEIDKPFLLIFGEKDCQVFEKDYVLWTEAMEKAEREYEAYLFPVNHMMMPCELSTMEEYHVENHVHKGVIKTIGKWINEKSKVK